jgi:alanine racemase
MHAVPSDVHVILHDIAPIADPIVLQGRHHARSDAHIRIEHGISRIGHREHKTFNKFYRKLTRMKCLFDMVVFDIRKNPHVGRIFPKGVTR